MKNLKSRVKKTKRFRAVVDWLKNHEIPGYPEVTWFAVIDFYFRKVDERDLTMRARSLSFSFFLSMFPSVIFFFTLIAYLPFSKLQEKILLFFSGVLPAETFKVVQHTIQDIISKQRGGWLSVGFLFAIYFSTNGFHSLMNSLNKYNQQKETRSFFKQRIVAIILAATVSVSLLFSVFLITFGSRLLHLADKMKYFPSRMTPAIFAGFNYLIVAGICLTIISTVYYFAPSKSVKFRFFSIGSVFASLSILITTAVFSFYVNQFHTYNKVYGSIGAIIVLMMIIYVNSYIVLLGYELNVAIYKALRQFNKTEKELANKIVYLEGEKGLGF
ncbi:MAG: YihY/virulence factor BrkB family protein [Bacteroidia bacterium]